MHTKVKYSHTYMCTKLYTLYGLHNTVHNMLRIPYCTHYPLHPLLCILYFTLSAMLYLHYYTCYAMRTHAHTVHTMLYTPVLDHSTIPTTLCILYLHSSRQILGCTYYSTDRTQSTVRYVT